MPFRRRDSLIIGEFDDEFVRRYQPHLREYGQQMPANAQMFHKWLGNKLRSRGQCSSVWDDTCLARLRNVKMDLAAIRRRRCIGEVVRHNSTTFVRHLEGRRSNVPSSDVKVYAGHHVGTNYNYHGVPSPLPSYARIVYIDVRKVRWCSVGSVPFHSFAWQTFDVRKAKSIARTM